MSKGWFSVCVFFFFSVTLSTALANLASPAPGKGSAATGPELALTPEERDYLASNPVVTMAISDAFPPRSFPDGEGNLQGINVDILRLIEKRLGIKFQLVPSDWKTALGRVRNKEADAIINASKNPSRDEYLNFTEVYLASPQALIARDNEPEISDLSAFCGRKVAVGQSNSRERYLREQFPCIERVPVKGNAGVIEAVVTGKADAGFSNYEPLVEQIQRMLVPDLKFIYFKYLPPAGFARIGIRKDKPVLASALNKAVVSLSQDEVDAITQKWLGFDLPPVPAGLLRQKTIELSVDEKNWLAANPDIKLVMLDELPPMVFWRDNGEVEGFIPDVFARVSEMIGQDINFSRSSVSGFHELAKQEGNYGTVVLLPTSDHRGEYLLTRPYIQTPFYIYTKRQRLPDVQSLSDLSGEKVAVIRGHKGVLDWIRKIPNVEVLEVDAILAQFQAVADGNADALLGYVTHPYLRTKYLFDDLEVAVVAENNVDVIAGVNPEHRELQSILNKAFGQLGFRETRALLDKWVGRKDYDVLPELTEPEQRWLEQGHKVRVRVSDWPPFMFAEPRPTGISVEKLRYVSDLVGFEIELVPDSLGWPASLEDLESKRDHYDLILTMKRTEEREGRYALTDDYLDIPWVVFTRDDQGFIDDVSLLNGKSVSVERGYVMEQLLRAQYPDIQLIVKENSQDAIEAVSSGAAFAYIGNLANATFLIQKNALNNVKVAGPTPFGSHTQAMAVRKDWPELAAIISKTLEKMPAAKRAEIYQGQLSVDFSPGVAPRLVAYAAALALLVIALVLLWNRTIAREVRRRKVIADQLRSKNELLDAVDRLQRTFIDESDNKNVFDEMLLEILRLTTSQYGFIDSLEAEPDGTPFLQALSITNIAWNEDTQAFYDQMAPGGMRFYDFNALFGQAVTDGKVVTSNYNPGDPRRKGMPDGHPSLDTFLAVPLLREGRVIGVIGLANREEGYSEELVEQLEVVWSACAQLVDAHHQKIEKGQVQDERDRVAAFYKALFRRSAPVSLVDLEKKAFVEFNDKFCELIGYPRDEVFDLAITDLDMNESEAEVAEHIEKILKQGNDTWETRYRTKDGSIKNILISGWHVHTDGKDYLQGVSIDITERKQLEQELLQRKQLIEVTLEGTGCGIWTHDFLSDAIVLDEKSQEILGASNDRLSFEEWSQLIHPDDRSSALQTIRKGIVAKQNRIAHDYRVVKDGATTNVKVDAFVSYRDDAPVTTYGLVQDVTEYALAKELLLRSKEKYQRLVDNLGERFAAFSVDFDTNKLLYVSNGFEAIFGVPASLALNKKLREVANWSPAILDEMKKHDQQLLSGEQAHQHAEYSFVHPNGHERFISITNHLSTNEEGLLVNEGIIENITYRKEIELELHDAATHDSLTSLFNKSEVMTKLDTELARARRYSRALAVLMLDLDHFKSINDEYGHPAGDEVLKAFAADVLGQIRQNDFAGRYGGEEFIVVLPESSLEEAEDCAERIRASVENLAVRSDDRLIRLTTSVGIAILDEKSGSTQGLIAHADEALYNAKASGRNRVSVFGQE